MDGETCRQLLTQHPNGTLHVDLDGSIRFANKAAIALLKFEEFDSDTCNFFDIWLEQKAGVREDFVRCAGSSAWLPITLTLARGPHAGIQVAMLARGMKLDENAPPSLVVVSHEGRREAFREHKKLVSELNHELSKQYRLRRQLEKALSSEKTLRVELVHRVKNNLSVLSTLVSTREDAVSSEEAKTALKELSNRIIAIALVHEILDRKREIHLVDAHELIEELCTKLETSLCPPGVVIERDLTPYPLHVGDATPLCLLINELVTNSLKHAFAGRKDGKVEVSLKRNGVDKLEVHVADNGRGCDKGDLVNGSGSMIVKALAEKLNGEISLHSDAGTTWQLIFPPKASSEHV